MDRLKMDGKRFMALFGALTVVLVFAMVFLVSAAQQQPGQQQQAQQRSSGLDLEAEPGLPASCTTAVYTQDGGEEIHIGKTYASTKAGVIESSVYAKNGGWLTLISPKITKTGAEGGDYGGQAVEASSQGVVNLLNAEIYTDTSMANGIWATEGASVFMKGGSINTIAGGGHGVDVTKRGSVTLYDVKISTAGQGASGSLVNDAGDGTVYATRVTAHTKGPGSSGFYMIGSMSMLVLNDSTLEAETSEAGVLVHGSNAAINNSALVGGKAGIKVSGGTLAITGGSLTVTAGDAFYVGGGEGGVPTGGSAGGAQGGMPGGGQGARGGAMPGGAGTGMPGGSPGGGQGAMGGTQGGAPGGAMPGAAGGGAPAMGGAPGGAMPGGLMGGMPGMREIDSTITVKNGTKISSTGNLITVAASTKGSFSADGTDLKGNVVVGEEGTFAVTLTNSTLTGTIKGAGMTLDRNSKWNVTGDSVLTSLSNVGGISGTSITNIYGNGHTVYYDKKLAENKALGGKTYNLANGGKLTPKK